jgi:hypothetical protein
MTKKYRIKTGIPREARKAYIEQAEQWCEYSTRFGNGEFDPECLEYRHYVRCTEHEYCHCTGDTLILICERCWPKVLNEIRRKEYEASPLPERGVDPQRELRKQITQSLRKNGGNETC